MVTIGAVLIFLAAALAVFAATFAGLRLAARAGNPTRPGRVRLAILAALTLLGAPAAAAAGFIAISGLIYQTAKNAPP